jgi:hypothetical protein
MAVYVIDRVFCLVYLGFGLGFVVVCFSLDF